MTRKELVYELARRLEAEPVYLGAPSFAYQVGGYTIDRQGRILDSEGREIGPAVLLPEEAETEPLGLEIGLPLEGFDGRSLRNLLHILYSKQGLIKKALGLENDLVNKEIINALGGEPMTTLEDFQKALGGKSCPGIDIDFSDRSITFQAGLDGNNPDKAEAASRLLSLVSLCAKRSKQNISPGVKATDNEKYTFRTWLLRLGMIGDEYKPARKVLLKNLSGNSAFRKVAAGGS